MSTIMPAPGRLRHLGRLTVHRSVFAQRFATDCATSRCDASCCALGVLVDVQERDARLIALEEGVTLDAVVNALNSLGVTPRDIIAIVQALKAAGSLRAEIVVI